MTSARWRLEIEHSGWSWEDNHCACNCCFYSNLHLHYHVLWYNKSYVYFIVQPKKAKTIASVPVHFGITLDFNHFVVEKLSKQLFYCTSLALEFQNEKFHLKPNPSSTLSKTLWPRPSLLPCTRTEQVPVAIPNATISNVAIPNIITFIKCHVLKRISPSNGAVYWRFHKNIL